MRAVDGDKIVKILTVQGNLEMADNPKLSVELQVYKDMLDEINEMPTIEPEPHWIPWDSGRFPDDSGTYIVTAYDGAKERVTFAKYQKRLKRWELTGARSYWKVLAWMPLPEPYKEDD